MSNTNDQDTPKPVKNYLVWFMPDSRDKSPPRYRVLFSSTRGLHTATIIPLNQDTPLAQAANLQGFWHRTSLTNPEELCVDVDNELMNLNPGKEIQYSNARWSF